MGDVKRIPLELHYLILSCIPSQDKGALCNCSLVCRSWFFPSRENLFRTIVVDSCFQLHLFIERVLHCEAMRPWLASVTSLQTVRTSHNERQAAEVVNKAIHRLAGHLPNLHTISLGYLQSWKEYPCHPRSWSAFSAFPSVRKLEIVSTSFSSFHTFRRLLESLPSLVELAFGRVEADSSLDTQASYQDSRPCRGPSLLHLRLLIDGQPINHAFFWWLSRTPSVHTIRDLSLSIYGVWLPRPYPHNTLYSFLQQVAGNVTSLEAPAVGQSPPRRPDIVG